MNWINFIWNFASHHLALFNSTNPTISSNSISLYFPLNVPISYLNLTSTTNKSSVNKCVVFGLNSK